MLVTCSASSSGSMSRIAEEEVVIDGIVVIAHQAIPYILPINKAVQWMVLVDVVTAVYHELLGKVSARVPAVEVSLVSFSDWSSVNLEGGAVFADLVLSRALESPRWFEAPVHGE